MKKILKIFLGVTLGAFLIWFLFRKTDWNAVHAAIRGASVGWLLLAQVFAWSGCFARVQRWSYVVRASHPATFRNLFSATQIGFLINFTIPVRIGELVRAYVLSRLAKLPLSQSVAMVALDRVNDIFVLLIIVCVALFSFPMERDITFATGVFSNVSPIVVPATLIRTAAISLTVFLCVILGLLLLLYVNQNLVLRFIGICTGGISERLNDRFRRLFLNFAAGMHVFRSSTEMAKSACFSILAWSMGLFSTASIMTAFGIDFPWFTPFVMVTMIAVFISVPIAPGMVGQYHIAIITCLLLVIPETDTAQAKAVAIVAHVLSLIPIAALGIFCLVRERLSFVELTRQVSRREPEDAIPPDL